MPKHKRVASDSDSDDKPLGFKRKLIASESDSEKPVKRKKVPPPPLSDDDERIVTHKRKSSVTKRKSSVVKRKSGAAKRKQTAKQKKNSLALDDPILNPLCFHPPLEFTTSLLPHQHYAVERTWKRKGRGLMYARPGLGKTLMCWYEKAPYYHNYCTMQARYTLPFLRNAKTGLSNEVMLLVFSYAYDWCSKDDWPARPLVLTTPTVAMQTMVYELLKHQRSIPREAIRVWNKLPTRSVMHTHDPITFPTPPKKRVPRATPNGYAPNGYPQSGVSPGNGYAPSGVGLGNGYATSGVGLDNGLVPTRLPLGGFASGKPENKKARGPRKPPGETKRKGYSTAETTSMLAYVWRDHTYPPWVEIIPHSLIASHQEYLRATGSRCYTLDESQAIKNPMADITKALVPILQRASRVTLLSGTPMNLPRDLLPQCQAVDPNLFPSREDYVQEYCNDGKPLQYIQQGKFRILLDKGRGYKSRKRLKVVLDEKFMVAVPTMEYAPSKEYSYTLEHTPPRGCEKEADWLRSRFGELPSIYKLYDTIRKRDAPAQSDAKQAVLQGPRKHVFVEYTMVWLEIEPSEEQEKALDAMIRRIVHRFPILKRARCLREVARLCLPDECKQRRMDMDKGMEEINRDKAAVDTVLKDIDTYKFQKMFGHLVGRTLAYKMPATRLFLKWFVKEFMYDPNNPLLAKECRKVVTFASRRTLSDAVEAVFHEELRSKECVMRINSKITGDRRQKNIDRFREDPECRVALLGYKSGGIAIDLAVADLCICVELCLNASDLEQAVHRINRLSQMKPMVKVFLLTLNKSLDDVTWKICEGKNGCITGLMDGRSTGLTIHHQMDRTTFVPTRKD